MKYLLNGKVKFRQSYSGTDVQKVNIRLFSTSCWKCSAIQHVYFIQDEVQSRCGKDLYSEIDDLISEYGIIVVFNGGIYNYQLGHFSSAEEANKVWNLIKDQGYKNSFVVSLRK